MKNPRVPASAAFMQLPFLKKKTETTREYLFALEVSHSVIKSAIWTVANNKPQAVSISSSFSWDDANEDSLIEACDQALTEASLHLDHSGKLQPEKVIFGLPSDWVTSEEKIVPDHLPVLKKLTSKLSLSAIGFVVTQEAIVRYLQASEGVPPTAILIGIRPHLIELSLVKLGKILGTHIIKRSASIAEDAIEGLSRFSHQDMLPSRILLHDSTLDLSEIKQQLLAHQWLSHHTKLPFLHFPKVEILPDDHSIKAIALSGGSEVAVSMGLMSEAPVAEPPAIVSEPETPVVSSANDFGFTEYPVVEEAQVIPTPPEVKSLNLPKFNFPASPLILGFIVLLLVVGSGVALWFLPTAKVTVQVRPQSLESSFDLTVDPASSSPDIQKPAIPGEVLETVASEQKTTTATGTKLVGDRAKGEVTMINGTTAVRTFPAGTALSSPNGLKFTTDAAVTVASASGTADPNSYQPGKANVKITADAIGTDSNVSAGTSFRVGTFSTLDYVAKNDAALSGGSSRQAKAVAKADIEKLKSDLLDTLKSQAKEDLGAKVGDGKKIIEETITLTTSSEKYSHKEGDIADDVSLDLAVKASGVSINTSDLDEIVKAQLNPKIPEGFASTQDIKPVFAYKSKDKNLVLLSTTIKAGLVPNFNLEDMAKNIKGKTSEAATSYLTGLPQVAGVDMSIFPPLPKFLLSLPHVAKNIKINIATQ